MTLAPQNSESPEIPETTDPTDAPSEALLPSILDVSEDDLNYVVSQLGQPAFRARQLWRSL